ncbi:MULTISPECIES: ATP/GTP-binding protein [Nocardia]|uniref:ATP/GTP-binding protein n=1 Tax=Nocardia TaxID=1817 RepID=UPI00245897B9|nr:MULTISPECIES: ATP/GTP-binding protein [Nocardia]
MRRPLYGSRRFVEDRLLRSYETRTPKPRPASPDALVLGRRRRREAARAKAKADAERYRAEEAARDPSRREPTWRKAHRLSRRGLEGPGGGAMGVVDPPPRFRSTTVQACGLYPFPVGDTHPLIGTPLGVNSHTGGTFCYDPTSATYWSRTQVTPSLFILGLPSFGKSSLARELVIGEVAAGRCPIIFADTKGEYTKLVDDLGGVVIGLGHGHGHLNPLALGALGSIVPRLLNAGRADLAAKVRAEVLARRRRLVQGLCEIERGERLAQIERNILGQALRMLDEDPRFSPTQPPLIKDLVELIEAAPDQLVRRARAREKTGYVDIVSGLLATLDALLDGDLGTVFAGPTSQPLNLADEVPAAVCVDISALSAGDDKLLAAVMFACWEDGFGAVEAAHTLADAGLAPQRTFLTLIDELWRVLNAGPGMVERINATTRLTRTLGTALLMITHTVKDLESLESESDVKKAKGFIERAGAVIVGALPRDEMNALDQIIPFTAADRAMVSAWSTPGMYDAATGRQAASPGRGKFLLKQGTQRVPGSPFETRFTQIEIERGWHDTDTRFAGVRAA